MSARRATHAGSWYTDSATDLARQLEGWLGQADLSHGPARAIIAPYFFDFGIRVASLPLGIWHPCTLPVYGISDPGFEKLIPRKGACLHAIDPLHGRRNAANHDRHAGYQYSGSVGAYAYRQVSPVVVKRVFILGPSHHVRLSGCALSSLPKYRTPLYDLIVDQQVYSELYQTGHFETMSVSADEDEHSIEMHLPYVAKIMEDFRDHFTIVPILVGSLTPEREILYGRLLAPYLADPQSLFVISSDFCHWGQRFRYTYYDRSVGEIWQSIQKLDKQGMNLIETLNPSAFTEYLKKYGNTICGRHPIGVLLNAVATLQKTSNGHRMLLKFLQYAQSSRCYTSSDSSVSYAAASLIFE